MAKAQTFERVLKKRKGDRVVRADKADTGGEKVKRVSIADLLLDQMEKEEEKEEK
jgi:hypothetical protein